MTKCGNSNTSDGTMIVSVMWFNIHTSLNCLSSMAKHKQNENLNIYVYIQSRLRWKGNRIRDTLWKISNILKCEQFWLRKKKRPRSSYKKSSKTSHFLVFFFQKISMNNLYAWGEVKIYIYIIYTSNKYVLPSNTLTTNESFFKTRYIPEYVHSNSQTFLTWHTVE